MEGLSSAPLNQRLPSSHPRRPHAFARGNPKTRGRSPALFFVSVPDESGAADYEVMGGDDRLWQRNGPRIPDTLLVSSLLTDFSLLF